MGKKRLTHTVIRKILLMAVLLMALSAAAQSPLEDGTLKLPRTVKDETVPPSPEAPTVIRPRANAVMYSRGLVTVSRELMSLRSGSLTLPVNISYTAIGVRCDDDGSLAGLGWTLECGGTVSRTVKGRPDEQRGIRVDAASKVSRCGDVSYLHDVLRGAVDADYDRYSYSVAGYSGSFIIKDGMVVQLPRTDVDIRLTGAEREGVRDFLIQTPSGERYLFGEREHTEYTYRPSTQTANASYISPDYRAVSGWHLTEADSIRYDTGHGLLQAEQTEIGGITIDRYLCYASNITSGALHRMASEGRYALPVIERYVVNGTDTIDVRTGYSRYGVAANIQRSYEEIVHNGRVTTRRDYADYDRRGNLLETSVDGGSPVSYLWGYGRTLPVAAVIGTGYDGMVHITTKTAAALEGEKPQSRLAGIISALRSDAALHVTSYGYAPLVGCTSETNLDGTSVYYGYSAGRLSSVSDNSRRVLKTYACTMAGEGPGIDNMTSETEYRDASGTEYSVKAVYYDGLGQPVRQAHTDSSGSASATAMTYDALGRKLAETVTAPVLSVSTYSDLKGLDTAASSYYMDGTVETAYAYGGSKYDNDITANGPGDLYAGMPRTRILSVNSGKEGLRGCVRLHIGADGRVRNTGLYAEGALTVEEVTDEDGRIGITFSDPLGCKVLERRSGDDGWLDTYYIHDNAGLLRAVLPPKVTIPAEGQAVSESDIERLAFRYRYDVRDRLSARKRPGCEWEHIAYDRTGRRLLVQDGNRRGRGRTGFELYDTLGRLCVSGECDAAGFDLGALNASGLRVTAVWKGGENELGGYEITAEGGTFSPTGISLTKVNYYDGYGFLGSCGMPAAVEAAYTGAAGFGMRHDDPCGKLTGSLTALYGTDGGASMLYSVNYYDDRGRIVEIHRSNADGKPCTERYAYGLTGDVLKHQTVYGYGAGGEDLFTYTYDASGRLASTGIGVDGGPVRMLEKRGYDPVGRLSHITSPGVDITYGYNIRGWVMGIDGGAAFRQKLYYAEESGQSRPLYSGDISRNEWTSRIVGEAGYSYFYDGAGRLAEARYSGDGHYSSGYSYDADGNLTGIVRIGTEVDGTETMVDDLTLTYSGNRLVSVSDRGEDTGAYGVMEFVDRSGSTEEYAYDANGNLTRDLNKDIVKISYNPINLPEEISFADGSRIVYTYDADGNKLRERYTDAVGRQIFRRAYDGSRVYRDGSLERIVTPCGYVTGGRIYTCVKDYQGNVRSVVRDDGEAVEATDYYPYGAPYSTARTVQPYKYGGKELNRMHGLDLYDSRARHYDPLLGRTTTMDKHSEKYYGISPYSWCNGNPIRYIDPDGNEWGKAVDFFNKSMEFSVSVGAQAGVVLEYGKKSASFDINLRSIDLYNSDGVNKVSEGFKIGYAGISLASEKSVWKETDDIAIITESTSIDIYGTGVSSETQHTATKETSNLWKLNSGSSTQNNEIYYDVPLKENMRVNLHFLIGIDLKINLGDLWNGIKELFSD